MVDEYNVYLHWQIFTLPKVSSKLKLKLTALEGCRVRKVTVANFVSNKDEYNENDLAVLTNLGDIHIISLPLLKIQVRYPCIRKEDVSGIASCVFTRCGQGNTAVNCEFCYYCDFWKFFVLIMCYNSFRFLLCTIPRKLKKYTSVGKTKIEIWTWFYNSKFV